MPLARRMPAAMRHGDEELDLMMQPSAIVQKTDRGDQRRAGDDAGALRARRAVEGEQNRQHHAAVHGEAAEQRNRLEMNLARSGKIDHADAQRERADRHGEHQRCEKSNDKGQHACGHETSI